MILELAFDQISPKMASLVGKVALVTGGGRGIGKAICRRFLEEKVKVCLADIDDEIGKSTLKEFGEEFGDENVIFEKLDVSNEDQFENVVKIAKEHFGGQLDILINNAGIGNEIDWKRMMHVNLFGVAIGIQLAHRHLCDSTGEKGETVINTASVLGIYPSQYMPAYSATKCGVVGVTLTWGHESNVQRTKVKVNAVAPDEVDTTMLSRSIGTIDEEKVKTQVEKLKRAGLMLKPFEIADGVIKILNDDVTREILVVSRSKGMYYYPFSTDDVLFESDKI